MIKINAATRIWASLGLADKVAQVSKNSKGKGPNYRKELISVKLRRVPTLKDLRDSGLDLPYSGPEHITDTIEVTWAAADGGPCAAFAPNDGSSTYIIEPIDLSFEEAAEEADNFANYSRKLDACLTKLSAIK